MIAIVGGHRGWHGLLTVMVEVLIFHGLSLQRSCQSSLIAGWLFATHEIFEVGMRHGQWIAVHESLRLVGRMFWGQHHAG